MTIDKDFRIHIYTVKINIQALAFIRFVMIIFVTHNPEIAQYSSRNITLRDGHVTADTVNTNILSAAEALARLPKNDD